MKQLLFIFAALAPLFAPAAHESPAELEALRLMLDELELKRDLVYNVRSNFTSTVAWKDGSHSLFADCFEIIYAVAGEDRWKNASGCVRDGKIQRIEGLGYKSLPRAIPLGTFCSGELRSKVQAQVRVGAADPVTRSIRAIDYSETAANPEEEGVHCASDFEAQTAVCNWSDVDKNTFSLVIDYSKSEPGNAFGSILCTLMMGEGCNKYYHPATLTVKYDSMWKRNRNVKLACDTK